MRSQGGAPSGLRSGILLVQPQSVCTRDRIFGMNDVIQKSVPQPVRAFFVTLCVLVAICFGAEAFCRFILHLYMPYDFPLISPHTSFWDFRQYFDQFKRLHTSSFFEGNYIMLYPAPVVVLYRAFYTFLPHATVVFIGFIVLGSLTVAALAFRAVRAKGVAPRTAGLISFGAWLLSYPLWFETKQGNMEIVLFLTVCAGLATFCMGREYTAATLFGIAGAMKFYPLIFLGLLLSKRRLGPVLWGLVASGATLILSLWFVGPGIAGAWHGTQAGLAISRRDSLLGRWVNEAGFDHSFFGLIKSVWAWTSHAPDVPIQRIPPELLRVYMPLVALVGIILYFTRIRKLPTANQILCLTVASIVFPPMSFDYTLLHLYAPWLVLVFVAFEAQRSAARVEGLTLCFVLLAICMAPLSEFIYRGEQFGGEARALVLLALFGAGLRFPLVANA